MENLTLLGLIDDTFHYISYNNSYAIPGLLDLEEKDGTWAITAGLFFLTMRTGSAMIEAGVVGKKNQVNVMMKNIVDMCSGGISFWIFGFALMFGRGGITNSFFGAGDFFANMKSSDTLSPQFFTLLFFQMTFASNATSIVSGSVSGRFKFIPYIMFSFLLTFVYSVGAGWVWGSHGWLKSLGVLDFSGAGPIHIIGGAAGFVSAWYIGPRIGRYDKGTAPLKNGDQVSICVGLFILWWGWIGFNSGSSFGISGDKWEQAARAGAGTTLATMCGGMTAMIISLIKHKGKVDVYEVVSGVVSALVAINSGCFCFPMVGSAITGIVAAILCLIAGPIVDGMKIDDAVGTTAVHFVNGIWGQVSVGLFADPRVGRKGLFINGDTYQLIVQTTSAVSLTVWASFATLIIIWLVDQILPIRLDPEDEKLGCDAVELYQGEEYSSELEKPKSNLDRIITIAAPIARRFSDEHRARSTEGFGQRRTYTNSGFSSDERF